MDVVTRPSLRVHGFDGAPWSITVHGGAGALAHELREAHRRGCAQACERAATMLAEGRSALDAVEAAVALLEADPLFNAGVGGALDADGRASHDAGLMRGADLAYGGVVALEGYAHPILVARAVLDDGRHVLLAGDGAARFAAESGILPAAIGSLVTQRALERWRAGATSRSGGTVGAVARDRRGGVAAATSTGGVAGRRAGRVGDSAIAGAGTYADDRGGACSTTGPGEAFLRLATARSVVHALSSGAVPAAAGTDALAELETRLGAQGGLILVGRDGSAAVAHTTETLSFAHRAPGRSADGV